MRVKEMRVEEISDSRCIDRTNAIISAAARANEKQKMSYAKPKSIRMARAPDPFDVTSTFRDLT